jgi:hypothetical protein
VTIVENRKDGKCQVGFDLTKLLICCCKKKPRKFNFAGGFDSLKGLCRNIFMMKETELPFMKSKSMALNFKKTKQRPRFVWRIQ